MLYLETKFETSGLRLDRDDYLAHYGTHEVAVRIRCFVDLVSPNGEEGGGHRLRCLSLNSNLL